MGPERLLADYLSRLASEARRLPGPRRGELVEEVREHIEVALGAVSQVDDAAVRTVLERLGSPASIVEAEAGPPEVEGATPRKMVPWWGPTEVAAILLVTVGLVALPVFGPLIGLALAWLSGRFATHTKIGISIIVLAVSVLPMATLFAVGGSTTQQGPVPVSTTSPTITSGPTEAPVVAP